MPNPKRGTVSVQDWLVRVLCAAIAAWLALNVDNFLVSNYANARFWETWVAAGSPLASWVPLVSFAFLAGVGAGIVIGLVFPKHISVKVAAVAAGLQLVEALVAGGILSAIVLAIGLVLGAMPSSLTR